MLVFGVAVLSRGDERRGVCCGSGDTTVFWFRRMTREIFLVTLYVVANAGDVRMHVWVCEDGFRIV